MQMNKTLMAGLLMLLTGCMGESGGSAASTAARASCTAPHWVAAWRAAPSDAFYPGGDNLQPLFVGPHQTFRSVISPTGEGDRIRIHLSNRFGLVPLTIHAASVAKQLEGASVDEKTLVALRFSGQSSVVIPAGKDVVSDPIDLSFTYFEKLAISLFTDNVVLAPTHHFLARQNSYATLPGAGDHASDPAADAFIQVTTTRPFVIGMDTLAPGSTSTVVAFGDSLTDGDQQRNALKALLSLQVPTEDPTTIDKDQRYPDFLARRLRESGRSVFVANAGIGANMVRMNSPLIFGGPSALSRLDADVLKVAGVTDVIFWEGINDIGQTPWLTAKQLTDAYVEVIERLQAAGLNVIQGTLTPSGNAGLPTYSLPSALALRKAVNEWIRTKSPANAVVDFDAAVRSSDHPDLIDPAYDGGDGLHFNAAGYARLAQAIDLSSIRGTKCADLK